MPCLRRSAFFLFCAEFRPKVKSENPGLTIGDTAKKLGEMWNSKTAEDKQPYEKKAAKLKEKYDKVTSERPKNDLLLCTKKDKYICSPQDIVAYRTKGKVDSESAATADDDEEEEDEEEGEEEEDDDEEDDE